MNMKKEKVIVEVSQDGVFAAYMPNDEYNFGLAGYGDSEQEAIDDFYITVEEMKELEKEYGRVFPDLSFEFEYDKESLLKYYSSLIGVNTLHKMTGIPKSRLNQYILDKTKPTKKSLQKIQDGIRKFAESLNRVALM